MQLRIPNRKFLLGIFLFSSFRRVNVGRGSFITRSNTKKRKAPQRFIFKDQIFDFFERVIYFHYQLHPTYFQISAIRKICGKKNYYNLKIKLSVPLIETCSTPNPLVTFKVEVLP